MIRKARAARSALYVLAGAAALALGGCGGIDGVELNGKVFDAMGLNSGGSSGEAKLPARSGLVVPPSTASLPEPGSRPDAVAADVDALQDPDKAVKVSQAEKQRQQDEYCKEHYELAKARGDDNADLAKGPLGMCKSSVITALQNWQKGDKNDDAEDTAGQ